MLLADEIAQLGQLVQHETPQCIAEEPVLSRWE
jgi:hypothetical protein